MFYPLWQVGFPNKQIIFGQFARLLARYQNEKRLFNPINQQSLASPFFDSQAAL
jgi:hypothetical protein